MNVLVVILLAACIVAYIFSNRSKEIILDDDTTLIDVRTGGEYRAGHLAGAINIPHTGIKEAISSVVADKNQKIILYCHSGARSGMATWVLKRMGYTNVTNAGAYGSITVTKPTGEQDKPEQ